MSDGALVERVADELEGVLCREAYGMEVSIARAIIREVADRAGEVADANPDEIVTWYMVEHWLREQTNEEEAGENRD